MVSGACPSRPTDTFGSPRKQTAATLSSRIVMVIQAERQACSRQADIGTARSRSLAEGYACARQAGILVGAKAPCIGALRARVRRHESLSKL
jgi:hypothetical protein